MLTHDVLVLDEGDYTVDVDGIITRYASDENRIVVKVQGCRVTIQSTADVPRKKRRYELRSLANEAAP